MSVGDREALPEPIDAAIEAHGGAPRWRELGAVEATISVHGALFTAKRRAVLHGVHVSRGEGRHDPRQPQAARLAFRHWRRQLY